MKTWILITLSALSSLKPVQGNIIFSQDFTSSPNGPVTAYVSSSPNSGQWNSIMSSGSSSVEVKNGSLNFTRTSSPLSYSRTADFIPAPEGVIFRFTMGLSSSTTSAGTAAVWQIGSGFGTANGVQANSTVHSQFALNIADTGGSFKFRDLKTMTDSGSYSGKFPITWVVNNTSVPLEYSAPNGTTRSVAADHWDLWCGPYQVLSGREATTTGQSLTDIKFAFVAGSGTISMDNFSVETLPAVPEPAATGTAAAAFLVAVVCVTEWRRRALRRAG